jgi:CubicO group peptidase (beta-lactamase class C family)
MSASFVRSGANPPAANVAHGYVPTDQGYEIKDTYPAFGGSGGIMTSIRDLQKFDRDFQKRHRVWTAKVRSLMLTPGTFTNGKPVMTDGLSYAAGLNVGTVRGLKWVSHGGSATAFRSEYVRLPDRKLGIAVLCNRGDAKPEAYVRQIIDGLGPRPIAGCLAVRVMPAMNAGQRPQARSRVA